MSVLCSAVVVCLQERVGYLEARDWEEVQMKTEKLSFSLPLRTEN